MSSAPASYGQLIAARYRDCADPFERGAPGALPSPDAAAGIAQGDLAFIAARVSQADELSRAARDSHGRLAEEHARSERGAVIDDLLAAALAPCAERRFSVLVTHDVDRATLLECTAMAKLFISARLRTLTRTFSAVRTCRTAIATTIDALLRFEADNGIRSVFFFLSGPYSFARYGSRLSSGWASAQGIIRAVKDAGMEIGLHGSYYAMDRGSYSDECRRLADAAQSSILHHRNHYLRYDPARFWCQLSEAGIGFDHSVGFSDGWGLRTGTCIPYQAYDFSAQAVSGVIEVPMLLMDGAWAERCDRAALGSIRAALETVRRHRGCVGINFHPESLAANPSCWESFKHILEICRELGADMAVPLLASAQR